MSVDPPRTNFEMFRRARDSHRFYWTGGTKVISASRRFVQGRVVEDDDGNTYLVVLKAEKGALAPQVTIFDDPDQPGDWSLSGDLLPDLWDNATQGCCLGIIRNAWGHDHTVRAEWVEESDQEWLTITILDPKGEFLREYLRDTVIETLVAALEGVPEYQGKPID